MSPETTFGKQLLREPPQRHDTRLARLGRIARMAARRPDEFVDIGQVNQLFDQYELPWEVKPIEVRDRPFYIAKRAAETAIGLPAEQPDPRAQNFIDWLGTDEIRRIIAVRLFTGKTLAKILQIEIDEHRQLTGEEAQLILSRRQAEVIRHLPLRVSAIACEVHGTSQAVRLALNKAKTRNHMSDEELVRAAYLENMIDTNLLPPARPTRLTALEVELLQNHAFATNVEAAEQLRRARNTINDAWVRIYTKMGFGDYPERRTKRTAFLVALREGIVR